MKLAEQFTQAIKNIKFELVEIKEDTVLNPNFGGYTEMPVEAELLATITFKDGSTLVFNPVLGDEEANEDLIGNPVYLDNLGRQL